MTIRKLYTDMSTAFKAISDTPAVDARVLICHALDLDYGHFLMDMDRELAQDRQQMLESQMERRLGGEPIAYILGERGFYECTFKVSEATLIPRADTEVLVENAITELKGSRDSSLGISILDLCCGTGCIGISVAKALARTFSQVDLTLSDLSEDALGICRQNVQSLITEPNIRASVLQGDLFDPMGDMRFDAILSNPPYICSSVVPTLEKQVRFEPLMALDGGEDGLDFVRRIAKEAPSHLKDKGLVLMEIGYDQGQGASNILSENGFQDIAVIRDYGGNDRVVKGTVSY